MDKNIIIRILCLMSFAVNAQVVCTDEKILDNQNIIFSFDGSLYPVSPLQQLRSCAMSIWSDVDGASMSSQLLFKFDQNIDEHAHKILDVYAILYGLQNTKKMDEVVAVEDEEEFRSLARLINDIEYKFDKVMVNHRSDQASCFKVVLQKIQKKLERMLA